MCNPFIPAQIMESKVIDDVGAGEGEGDGDGDPKYSSMNVSIPALQT